MARPVGPLANTAPAMRGSDFYGIMERRSTHPHTRGESTFQLIDGRLYAPRALDVIDVKCIAAHRLYQGRNAPSMNGGGGKGVNARLQHVILPALWQWLHSQSVT